jgi:hypothetical protein
MQLGASLIHEGNVNISTTAVSTDRIYECDTVVEDHDNTNLSDVFKSTALRVAFGKDNLSFFLLYGPDVKIPFARLSFYCCRI